MAQDDTSKLKEDERDEAPESDEKDETTRETVDEATHPQSDEDTEANDSETENENDTVDEADTQDSDDEGEDNDRSAEQWKSDSRKWEARSKQNMKDLTEAQNRVKDLEEKVSELTENLSKSYKANVLNQYGLSEDFSDFITGTEEEMKEKAAKLAGLGGTSKQVGTRTQGFPQGTSNEDPFKSYAETFGR